MSESIYPHDEKPPFANVRPIDTARSREYDFTQAPIELSVDFLFSELRHPAYSNLNSLELAAFLEIELTVDETRDAREPQEVLARTILNSKAFDDDIFDTRIDQDSVFNKLVSELRRTASIKDLEVQRRVALKLIEVRILSPSDDTHLDDQWHDVIKRLFTQH